MVSMKDLLECGVHFGHQTRRWNPKMKKFIFGERKNIYIIDLQKTLRYFRYTYNIVRDAAAEGKTILFVGTKKQAVVAIKEAAEGCGMPFVNHRWLGGMMTNFNTIRQSIRKLEIIEEMEKDGQIDLLTKKEALMLRRKKEKLISYLGGLRNLKTAPDMLFVIDTVKERIAVAEANRLKIPVVAPLDTNCDPDVVDFPIPGNDDAIRSVQLFCKEMMEAVNEGKELKNKDAAEPEESSVPASKQEKDELFEEILSEEDDIDIAKEFGVVGEEAKQEEPKAKKAAKSVKAETTEAKEEEPKAKKSTKKTEEAESETVEEKPKRVRKPKAAKEEE
ncbi:MAG: 30S ribosomal protein S2 [Campylobacteraceae bacterium]|nr:30S ribosomal protein S2 [Campylobacteraceae bacterium]